MPWTARQLHVCRIMPGRRRKTDAPGDWLHADGLRPGRPARGRLPRGARRGGNEAERVGVVDRLLGDVGTDTGNPLEHLQCKSDPAERRADLQPLHVITYAVVHLAGDRDALLQSELAAALTRALH